MVTKRKVHDGHYTEVKRVVAGEVRQTTCCCAAAGETPRACATVAGNKTPCACFCHVKTHTHVCKGHPGGAAVKVCVLRGKCPDPKARVRLCRRCSKVKAS